MSQPMPKTLFEAFSDIPDHRHRHGNRHPLPAVLTMTVAAMLSGCTSLAAISQWGREMYRTQRERFWKWGFDSFTTPSVSTLHYIFSAIDIQAVETVIAFWIRGLIGDIDGLSAISIDGKTLKGSQRKKTEAPGVHLISAYRTLPGCVLFQHRVEADTNEPKAALDLIDRLILENAVIVGDAIFCQKELAQAVVDRGGDYFFVVKDNQATLKEAVSDAFAEPFSPLGKDQMVG